VQDQMAALESRLSLTSQPAGFWRVKTLFVETYLSHVTCGADEDGAANAEIAASATMRHGTVRMERRLWEPAFELRCFIGFACNG